MLVGLVMMSALATAGASAPPATKAEALPLARCDRPDAKHVSGATPLVPQRLGELPSADRIAAVYRDIDGCPSSVMLTRGKR